MAQKLGTINVGNSNKPIYLEEGTPKECVDFLPLSAGENKKLIGPLGLTENINYGTSLPDNGFDGQLFFVEDENLDGPSLPTGGTAGQVLTKNSSEDGDASWATDISGNAATATKLKTARTISLTGSVTGSGTFDGSGDLSIATTTNHNHDSNYVKKSGDTMTGTLANSAVKGGMWITGTHECTFFSKNATTASAGQYYQGHYGLKTPSGAWSLGIIAGNDDLYFVYGTDADYAAGTNNTNPNVHIASNGGIYGAVWNDYAEFRICNEDFKPGQVVFENGNDTLSITNQRLQRGCSIVSDTFGFAIGQTDEAKCPIAVSGRVLAYGYESREEFAQHIGWPVCSGPNGTVSIMTEEEEEKYPSRIIGIVSTVPDYETWGTGNVSVDGRIWIKVV